jgi:hypothetical protein
VEGSGSFLKKRTKKLFPVAGGKTRLCRAQTGKVFLLLFLQKKKIFSCFLTAAATPA